MRIDKLKFAISSYKRYFILSVLSILFIVAFFAPIFVHLVKASFGSWGDTSLINACENSRGGITLVSPGTSCNTNETQVTWLKDVDAGSGLSISRSSSGATLSLTNGSIGTASLADGSVTPDKISNDASESSRLTTWSDDTNNYSFSATAGGVTSEGNIDPSISVTVPTGKSYYYLVQYDGLFSYIYSERASGQTSFYATWYSSLLDGSTSVSTSTQIVHTGYRYDWAALGNSSSWSTPFHATWFVQLGAGTHNLKMDMSGYSDATMNYAHITGPRIQLLRVF